MGSWISAKQFEFLKIGMIKRFIGIGSAPEFLERVMWKKFSKENEDKEQLMRVFIT